MTKQFFITGLPRSRTAWFANLFTWGNSLCYHDALCDISKSCLTTALKALEIRLAHDDKFQFVGHSDASNILFWRQLSTRFERAKWVAIERDVSEVAQSASRITGSGVDAMERSVGAMNYDLSVLIRELSPLVVQFDDINVTKCYEIAEYLGIDIGPATRVRQLCDMNIQIHPPILRKRLEALKCQQVVDTPSLISSQLQAA